MPKQPESNFDIEETPSTKRGLQPGYTRATFIVKEELAYKLNCIASMDDVFLKDTVNEALEKYVADWEKANTKIVKRKKK